MNDTRLRERIEALKQEKAVFEIAAPVRAQERVQGLAAQLEGEIALRLEMFDLRIQELMAMLEVADA